MNSVSWFACCISLLFITLEDLRKREIHVAWFILLGIAELSLLVQSSGFGIKENLGINALFLISLIGGTYVIFKLRRKGQFFDHYFGWGDVLMMICLSLALEPYSLIVFVVGSSWCILLALIGLHTLTFIDIQAVSIPLAGIWALGLLVLIVLYRLSMLPFEIGLLW
ncbi:MAG: hypothetical protein AAFY71_24460 [Bacteroidota bacterium]